MPDAQIVSSSTSGTTDDEIVEHAQALSDVLARHIAGK